MKLGCLHKLHSRPAVILPSFEWPKHLRYYLRCYQSCLHWLDYSLYSDATIILDGQSHGGVCLSRPTPHSWREMLPALLARL
jgi:hypothetical protein